MDDIQRNIDPNEQQLNSLFKEVLDGLRDDIYEAQLNVDMYASAIAVEGGKEQYGTFYNQALAIKGSARDRQLKFLNTFKERVTRKEEVELKREFRQAEKSPGLAAGTNITDMNKFLEEMAKSGQLSNINLDMTVDDLMNEEE